MAIPWLSALKVIPWGDVISHAPSVLEKARDLMTRKPADAAPSSMATPNPREPREPRSFESQLSLVHYIRDILDAHLMAVIL